MNKTIQKKLIKLQEAMNESENPDFTRLEVFVDMLDHVGITPRFIIEDVTGNVLGVQLELESGEETATSAPLPTELPLRVIAAAQ